MFNYENIGSKIKGLAQASFFVEAIAAVISGIVLMAEDNDFILLGLLILFVGPIVAWVLSWVLYGFGQLVENSDILTEDRRAKQEKDITKSAEKKQIQKRKEATEMLANPSVDGDTFIDIACPNCKEELSFPKEQLQSGEELTCPICGAKISF